MKKLIFLIMMLFLNLSNIANAADTYTFDPDHSYIQWHISHFGFSNPSGKWMVNGSLTLDQKNPQLSKVTATIKLSDIITGINDLDKHLKGALFFNVAQYPLATFTSDKVIPHGDSAKVQGMLTLHGVSKPVTLDIKLNKSGISPITNKMTAGFTGSTTLKRSDFGITTLLPGVGDDVKINIEAEAVKNE